MFGPYVIGKVQDIRDLKSVTQQPNRAHWPILVVDDEKFGYEDLLRKHSFNLTIHNDLNDIKAASEYPIFLCDVKGVGKALNSNYEGAHLMKEVRQLYPGKIIYAYTGHTFDPTYNKYFSYCDAVLKKDIDLEDWIENLDRAIEMATDPIEAWKRLRDYLLTKDVPLHIIFQLEQSYITSVKKKNIDFFRNVQIVNRLSDSLKSVIFEFAGNQLKKLISPI